jgi:DNA repair protein RadD
MAELRGYQTDSLNRIRDELRAGHRRVVLGLPTGAGKTRLAAEIVSSARGRKKRVIFEVPAISLVDQTVEMFYAEGIKEVGVIQASHHMTDWSQPIQVASVQTLQNTDVPEADVVIRDECHKLFKFDVEWMLRDAWRNKPFIGLSATPWTKGLGRVYEKLVIGATLKQLIKDGVLAAFNVFSPSHPDLKGVRTVAGEFHQGELSGAMRKGTLVADIIETWKKMAEGRPTVCFAVDRAHASALKERFEGAGVPAGYLDCNSTLYERAEVSRDLEKGRIKVVCNVDVVGMGVDWPFVSCISYCRPTKSEIRFVQNIGRGLRKCAGKEDLLVLDHSDTHLRLGFVTDIEHLELSDGRMALADPERHVRLPKECPSCGYLKSPGVLVCPNCNYKADPPPAVREYTGEDLARFAGKKKHKAGDDFSLAEKAIFLAELKAYAAGHGYKPGWAAVKYKGRFEVWPDWSIKNVPASATISAATASWIKHENIKWAKSKRNGKTFHRVNGSEDHTGGGETHASYSKRPVGSFVEGTLMTEQDAADAADGL